MISDTRKKTIIIRRLCMGLMILLLSVLQNIDGLFPQLFSARALLLIPAVTCISMFERDIAGMLFGLFAGALWDIFSSGGDFNAIFLMTVGFLCGTLINTIMRNNLVTATLLTAVASSAYTIGYWLIHYIIPGLDRAFEVLIGYYIPTLLYTLVFAPIMFILIRAVQKKFSAEA